MAMKWYIVHTYSGYEQRVKEFVETQVQERGIQDKIAEVFIPVENIVERKKGKTVTSEKKFFPGYILVRMDMDDEEDTTAWEVLKDTPRVTGFVGPGAKPTPIPQEEVDGILQRIQDSKEAPQPQFSFQPGDHVRIVDGPFSDFTGDVDEVNEDKKTVRVKVAIFGRETPVEVEFLQAERV